MKWSEKDVQFLLDNYKKGAKYCSDELKRTKIGIIKKAKRLGIRFDNIKDKYRKENIEKVISLSNSIGDVLDKMSLRKAGGNYEIIKKYISLYELDTSHFIKSGDNMRNVVDIFVKKKLNTYLTINSKSSRSNIKRRIIEEGLLKNVCLLCGQDENWNGVKISLILDHINGVYNDNRIENLRIVCPNCNAGLETHCSRNCKVKKESIKIIKKNPNRKVERPTYEVLKDDVFHNGYSSTGRKYGVSDNSIRKWIKYYEKKSESNIL